MHLEKVLHKFLTQSCLAIHQSRLSGLARAVSNATKGQNLSITGLGRCANGEIAAKHEIKRMDRVVGNVALYQQRKIVYQAIAQRVIGNRAHPWLLVDWSNVDENDRFRTLRASVVYQGRGLVIYDQVQQKYSEKETGESIERFLKGLSEILPTGCRPIIITDAEFNAGWFMRLIKRGWYFVGRVRGKVKLRKSSSKRWLGCQSLHQGASEQAKELGEFRLSKAHQVNAQLFLYKGKRKGRVRKNKDGSIKQCHKKQDYAKQAKEPWLLASNLPKRYQLAKYVVSCYRSRMQIEEGFRDTKDPRYGLGIRRTLSRSVERIAILLLIAAIALLFLTTIGKIAVEHMLARFFQSNTRTSKSVLSLPFLGRELLAHTNFRFAHTQITEQKITHAILSISSEIGA